jgi:hypothetical protein
VIAFWLLFTRRVHTVFASTGLTNVYRQKLTGNLFGRIVDGNYYFIDGHARATDLSYPAPPPPSTLLAPLLFIGSCSVLRKHRTLLSKEHQRHYAVLCIKTDRDISPVRLISHRARCIGDVRGIKTHTSLHRSPRDADDIDSRR